MKANTGYYKPWLESNMNIRKYMKLPVLCMIAGLLTSHAGAAMVFSESWESAALTEGSITGAMPAGWIKSNGTPNLWRPGTGAQPSRWDSTEPLAAPADGNHVLFINESSFSSVYNILSEPIQAGMTYTLDVAIGWDNALPDEGDWSIQLWADDQNPGTLQVADDIYLGQMFQEDPSAIHPAQGSWALNTVSFTAVTGQPYIGKNLAVQLSNYNGPKVRTAYFDNVQVSVIPEPSSVALTLLGLLCAVPFFRRRKRARN